MAAACSGKGGGSTTPVEPPAPDVAEPASEGGGGGGAAAITSGWEIRDNALVLPAPVAFESGSATLAPDADAALETIRTYLEEKTYISTLRVEGHVKDAGGDEQALSEQRALAVTGWLVGHGIDCKRLIPVGFGANKPAFGDERDTRIEAVNAALRGHAIGGMPVDGGGQVAGDACR